jgi:hypothetical protein
VHLHVLDMSQAEAGRWSRAADQPSSARPTIGLADRTTRSAGSLQIGASRLLTRRFCFARKAEVSVSRESRSGSRPCQGVLDHRYLDNGSEGRTWADRSDDWCGLGHPVGTGLGCRGGRLVRHLPEWSHALQGQPARGALPGEGSSVGSAQAGGPLRSRQAPDDRIRFERAQGKVLVLTPHPKGPDLRFTHLLSEGPHPVPNHRLRLPVRRPRSPEAGVLDHAGAILLAIDG